MAVPFTIMSTIFSLCTTLGSKTGTCASQATWAGVNFFCFVAGKWQGQRAKAVEKALLGKALDLDALIKALQALPQDLHPTPTPGMQFQPPVI